eukprot:3138815-Rhodomonas_salina.1
MPALSKFGHHTLEEIIHLHLIHTPSSKTVHLNGRAKSLPHMLLYTRLTQFRCACCDEANSQHCNYPPASTTPISPDRELWHWDMLDM